MRLPELQQLVSPFPPEVFVGHMDGKEAVLLRPVLSTPLELAELDRIIADTALRYPTVTLRDGDDELSAGSFCQVVSWGGRSVQLADPDSLREGLSRGCCVCLPELHRQHGPTARLVRALERTFHMRGRSTAVLAPADARAWSARQLARSHRYILQCVGRRTVEVTHPDLPPAVFEQVAGTAVYVPPGASTRFELDGHALWLDIELTPITASDVAAAELKSAASTDKMRGVLPVGLFGGDEDLSKGWAERVERILEDVDHESVLDGIVERFVQTRLPLLGGQLGASERRVHANTTLRRRPGLMYRVVRVDRGVELRFHGKTVGLPPGAEELLEFAAEQPSWRAGELPLPESHRLGFVHHLLREGFVEVVRG